MPQSPSIVFRDSLNEASRLIDIHTMISGPGPGRKRDVEVLNKSAILFICAAFEAFLETLASDAFSHLASVSDASKLPKALRQAIASDIKVDKNDLAMWSLAGDGWKTICDTYKVRVIRDHTKLFNTPKAHLIDELFKKMIGLQELSKKWGWKNMSHAQAVTKLAAFVELRGAIAHGQVPAPKVTKRDVQAALAFLPPLSVRCSNIVREHCRLHSDSDPFMPVRFKTIR